MNRIASLCVLSLALSSATATADGVPVDPGLWEMNMTIVMPMLPQPHQTVETECIEENELNPEAFQMDPESPCQVGEIDIDGDTISWSMECQTPGGPASGQWSFTSAGDRMNGNGSMLTSMGDQKFEFSMTWDGQRIGDCPQAPAQ